MNFEIVKYVLFILILAYIPMWVQINMLLSSFGKKKRPVTLVKDKKIDTLLWKKAKTKLGTIKIFESRLLFGAMAGIPGNPQLMLSKRLYEEFNESELEYVLLHEAGHYKLRHTTKELLEGIAFLFLGVFLLNQSLGIEGVLKAGLLSLVFGILMIQLAKISELQADEFAVGLIDNPNGMISATKKFAKAWERPQLKSTFLRFLFNRGNPYENRIKMAEEEIERRKK